MSAAKHAVRAILEGPGREWSVQGLGMLRTYLPGNTRLHIWNPDLAAFGVSELHTHPWDLRSYVVAGVVHNERFVDADGDPTHMRQRILCGEGGGLCGAPEPVALTALPRETYEAGYVYSQAHDEIHRSEPEPGAVTIIERSVPAGGSPDHADVFWPVDEEWVSAMPGPATPEQIRSTLNLALEQLA